jgi:phage terminase large subunit-like protein
MYSAEKPDQLRGPQHQFVWGDEFAAWKRLEAWTNLMDGNRLRSIPNLQPQVVLTTTPRRTDLVSDTFLGNRDWKGKRLVSKEQMRSGSWEFTQTIVDKRTGLPVNLRTVVRRWSTEENASNLSAGYAAKRRMKYGDSSLGRQELDAEILEKVEGALWQQETFDTFRVSEAPKLKRIEVAVDPTRSGDPVDECGIVVGGLGFNGESYILADLTMKGSPDAWIRVVAGAYHKYRADAVILEDNLLGEDIKHALRTALSGGKFVPVSASSDKAIRAAPVSALYEQGKVHHVTSEKDQATDDNPLAALEEECCVWDPQEPKMSPNRLDAAVWLVTSLMIGVKPSGVAPRGVGTNPRAGSGGA